MKSHWIVLADASRARVLASDVTFDEVEEVADLLHPEGRLHTSELMSDDRGRSQSGPGGVHTALDAHTDRHEVEHGLFARELADAIAHGLDEGRYEALVLVAPPHFLGLLRRELPERVTARVHMQLDRDLTRLPLREVSQALRTHLPA